MTNEKRKEIIRKLKDQDKAGRNLEDNELTLEELDEANGGYYNGGFGGWDGGWGGGWMTCGDYNI